MPIANRLELIRTYFDGLGQFDKAGYCVLMLSYSGGSTRAVVHTFRETTFNQAWALLHDFAMQMFNESSAEPEHLRVDRVCNIEPTSWAELKDRLSTSKRNYFTRGIALDAQFEHSFLWGELNGNAMLYGGADVEFAQLNVGNFEKYARKKYGNKFTLNHAGQQPVWLFDAQGAYCSEDAVLYPLEQEGVATGCRVLPPLDAAFCVDLVTTASEFLARQVKESGLFVYGLFPCFNREIPNYNTLRHASSTYAMIEAWEITQSEFLKASIDRSLLCLTSELIKKVTLPGGIEAAFLVDTNNEIKLGGNAVCILALAKYTELTGNAQYIGLMELLAQGLVAMLNPSTRQFVHVLNFPDLSVKEQFRIIYYDGEAAFALMRLYKITRRARWLQAVELAFEYFIEARHWKANDHWLSYCVNELTLYRPRREYFEFGIRNFANHLDFVLTRITTFPTLLELMMAAEQMLKRLQSLPEFADLYAQVDREKFDRALHWRANYLLTAYFWPEWAMYFAKPDSVVGAFFIRHHAYRVRIDDVEHYVSGLVAYRKLLQRMPAPVLLSGPVRLNARLTEVTVWFLNQNMAFQRSGVENAALLRNQVFTRELQVQPVLLTCRYNPRLSESIQRLVADGVLPATQKYQSVYDFLQNAEHIPAVLNTGESILSNPAFHAQPVANRRDVRVGDRHGHLLMYLVRNPDNDALEHINHFCNGVKFRKDHYDARGFLSRIQYLHETTALPAYEHYLRLDGSLAIAKFYRCVEGKMVLQNIRLHNAKGDVLESFSSEQGLITHALIAMLARQGGKHVLIVDKNRLLYKPAIAAQDHIHRNTPGQVAVVPVIHALHTQAASDMDSSPTNSNFRDILHAIERPDAIVTLTEQQKADIQTRYGPGRVFSIGHSYETDLPATPFAQRNRFQIVSMARYSSEKNQHLAIDAFALVLQQYPQASLDFYGFAVAGDPLLAALKARIEALGLQGSVRLNGWADNPALHYESAGLSLLTSQGEAFSLAIMESLCHACPPIAFDVPYGPSHLIEQGQTGLLVPFGDVPALAAAILSVFGNPTLHQQLSEQARANSSRFRHAEHARQWSALCASVGVS